MRENCIDEWTRLSHKLTNVENALESKVALLRLSKERELLARLLREDDQEMGLYLYHYDLIVLTQKLQSKERILDPTLLIRLSLYWKQEHCREFFCSITSLTISVTTRRELIFVIPMVQMLWARLLLACHLLRVQKFYLMSGGVLNSEVIEISARGLKMKRCATAGLSAAL